MLEGRSHWKLVRLALKPIYCMSFYNDDILLRLLRLSFFIKDNFPFNEYLTNIDFRHCQQSLFWYIHTKAPKFHILSIWKLGYQVLGYQISATCKITLDIGLPFSPEVKKHPFVSIFRQFYAYWKNTHLF